MESKTSNSNDEAKTEAHNSSEQGIVLDHNCMPTCIAKRNCDKFTGCNYEKVIPCERFVHFAVSLEEFPYHHSTCSGASVEPGPEGPVRLGQYTASTQAIWQRREVSQASRGTAGWSIATRPRRTSER
jgi:hypothetical protein